jgi:hypothetical protein
MAGLQTLATQLESGKPRVYPIDVESVIGPIVGVSALVLQLPEGWKADLPNDVVAESAYGSYRAEYSQNGRELRLHRRMEGKRGVKPPEDVDALIAWLRAVAKDDVQYIVLQRPAEVGK